MVRQTSIQAYDGLRRSRKLCKQQKQVYDYLLAFPGSSDKEISRGTGLPINSVTGRRNELLKLGLVRGEKIKVCQYTGRKVYAWRSINWL